MAGALAEAINFARVGGGCAQVLVTVNDDELGGLEKYVNAVCTSLGVPGETITCTSADLIVSGAAKITISVG